MQDLILLGRNQLANRQIEAFLGLKSVAVSHFRTLIVLFSRIILDVSICMVLGWRPEVAAALTSEVGA